jgi:L-seryl-tRNA(Ser) seleniumtransferase
MADLRIIPSIDQIRQRAGVRALEARYGHHATVAALRGSAEALRARIASAAAAPHENARPLDAVDAGAAIEVDAATRLAAQFRPSLSPVINATGVILHTNLGRAPLAPAAVARLAAVAGTYSNLEYDLAAGARGSRQVHASAHLCRLTGAEAAVIVNNNAAAVLLVLAALAAGREVVVSRGELVEIGGGFRVPDVMTQSGARLREVGTTNRTRVSDYAAAIGDRTAAILRVHPSNFRVEGFAARPSLEELSALGRRFDIPVIEDLGSGYLRLPEDRQEGRPDRLGDEPAVQESIEAGADVICFSGDKLLGGPQAGIIVGREPLVATIRQHPLMRALRADKLTYAALEATLAEYLAGRAAAEIPVRRMLALDAETIRVRADALAGSLRRAGWTADVREGRSTIGGGSAPGATLPTWLIALSRGGLSAHTIEESMRQLDPPVIARIEEDRVLMDLRTVPPEEDTRLSELLAGLA